MNRSMTRTITALLAGTALVVGLASCGTATATDDAGPSSSSASPSVDAAAAKAAADKAAADAKAAAAQAAADAKAKAAADAKAKAAAAAKAKADAAAAAKAKAAAAARITNAQAPAARTWAKIVKDPDAYVGKVYVIYGQVNQFDAATGTDTFLGDSASKNTLSYGYFDGENTMFNGTEKLFADFVEDDVFKATVEVAGSFSYDTQIGGNTTVPLLKVHRIKRI